jgi:hypothetical protein
MMHNHWSIWCDTEEPVTCVYGGNELNWEYLPEMLDPTDYSEVAEEDQDCYEPISWLIGDWARGEDGLWDVVQDGPNGFAMLYDSNDNIAQLVWSRTTGRGRMCSPCYPGQVDSATVQPDFPPNIVPRGPLMDHGLVDALRECEPERALWFNYDSIGEAVLQKCYVLPDDCIYKD